MDKIADVVATPEDNGKNVQVKITYAPPATSSPWESSGMQVGSFSGMFTYSKADKAPVSSRFELKGTVSDPTGKQAEVNWQLETHRISINKLSEHDLQSLREDVLAGVPVFDKVRASLVQGDEGTSEAINVISDYVSKYPKGEFAAAYEEIREQLQRNIEMISNAEQIRTGKAAPLFTAKTINDEPIRLTDLRGKVVLLDFWATWCMPCVMEIPNVKMIYEAHKDEGFTVIGISADNNIEDLRTFVKENDVTWKQIYDGDNKEENSILVKYAVQQFPTTMLLDREGTIRLIDARGEDLEEAIAQLVKEK
jgi:peroxiredoxin